VAKMQVDRYKIHDIELVVDRLPVNDEMKFRLSQSVQKTLQLGKDLMFVAPSQPPPGGEELKNPAKKKSVKESKDSEAPPREGFGEAVAMFSKQLMCIDTGISYEEPSPNAFSFNSPYGACPTCKGLGNVYTIDMDEVLPDKSKTVKEGGIIPL
jgi:excinuclease ABC subunit A